MPERAGFPAVVSVVLHFGDPAITERCVRSLRFVDLPGHRVLVVDNDPSGTGRCFAGADGDVGYVRSPANLGYTGGMNLGIRHAAALGARFVQLLNNDVEIVEPSYLRALVAAMESDPGLGILGPLVWLRERGTVQRTALLDPRFARLILKRRLLAGAVLPAAPGTPDRPEPAEAVNGVAILIRREVFVRIGLLDEGYFMYAEELDFCRRARDAGFRCATLAVPAMIHHQRAAPAGAWTAADLWVRRNIVRFLRIHHGWPEASAAALYLSATATARALRCRLAGDRAAPARLVQTLGEVARQLGPAGRPVRPSLEEAGA